MSVSEPWTSGILAATLDRLTSLVFLALLALPGITLALKGTDVEGIREEGRTPAPFPDVDDTAVLDGSFSGAFEDWFADAQGTRITLLRWRNRLWWFGLRHSPTPDMVRSEEGWIFTTKRTSIPVFRGLRPLTLRQLETLRNYIERRAQWLALRDIEMLLVIAPNKQSIYPERIPERYTQHGPTQLDQLLEHMAATSDVPLHDFRTVLRAETAHDRPEAGDYTYHPLGTHWTDRGARVAAATMIDILARGLAPDFPGWGPLPDDAFRVEPRDTPGDSSANRLHLSDLLTQSVYEHFVHPPRARMVDKPAHTRILRTQDETLPDAVVMHDSFGLALWPILSQSFHESIFLSVRGANDDTVEAADPDVVVMIIVERNLLGLPDFWPFPPRGDDARRPGN